MFRPLPSISSSNKRAKKTHRTPEIVVEIRDRDGIKKPIRALIDTGTTSMLLLKKFLSKGSPKAYKTPNKTIWRTMGGTFKTHQKRFVEFHLPEFSHDKSISWVVHVDDTSNPSTAVYDMVIGCDLMTELGLKINFTDNVIIWDDVATPMKTRGFLSNSTNLRNVFELVTEPSVLQQTEQRQKDILDAEYSAVDIVQLVQMYEHLTLWQRTLLCEVLFQHNDLFQGGLGTCNVRPVDLELIENAKPYHARAYPVPKAHELKTHKEQNRLVSIGVLEKDYNSPWEAATFIQPKKTGDIRVLTDFRRLNAALKRKPFPIPRIADLLLKLESFTYATALDLCMGYYHIPLTEEASKLCTTILPWGKYLYKRLPMDIKNATDIIQNVMMELLGDLPYIRVYLDDILITTKDTYEDHMNKLNEVLTRLEQAGFRANLLKCFFAEDKLDYLGYWITRKGIQPQPKKVAAIRHLNPPSNKRQLRCFLGMINYYRDMWRQRSHILAPLAALQSNTVKWKWSTEEQSAFDEIKRIIEREAILAFPDFSKPFHIHTDSSYLQLGSVITQSDKPIAFYSRKMNDAQKRYPTGEQELQSIVETLKEFKNILLGQNVIIHTDHKNLLYEKSCFDRIIHWQLLLEEYAPTYIY
jgi:RNase H-like domain found in reverse transcriptase/Reverse transcriptase (RNA-dependent DNA polymerase)/Retroviral aspartyl protease